MIGIIWAEMAKVHFDIKVAASKKRSFDTIKSEYFMASMCGDVKNRLATHLKKMRSKVNSRHILSCALMDRGKKT